VVEYELKGRIVYLRRKTAGKALRRASVVANALERDGFTVEAITVYCSRHEADPWAATILVQEA
jgi:uroporphyrinogen-III synthase